MEAINDEHHEHPIATSWRPTITEVANALSCGDFSLNREIRGVHTVPDDIADANRRYVKDYGETLNALPNETWDSSCAQWMGSHWNIIVDLFTVSEGRSDLVLTGKVTEENGNYTFQFGLIYVP